MVTKDLIKKYYMPEITQSNVVITTLTIGTEPVRVLENNPSRFQSVIVNLSPNNVYVGFDNQVSSSKGIRVAPNGGDFRMIWIEDLDVVTWEFFAVADDENSNILVIQFVLI
jgi:c-di-GMP-binding flagellar brake protein YcgR